MLQFAQYLELAEPLDPCIQNISSPHFSRFFSRTRRSRSTWSWPWKRTAQFNPLYVPMIN